MPGRPRPLTPITPAQRLNVLRRLNDAAADQLEVVWELSALMIDTGTPARDVAEALRLPPEAKPADT